MDIIRDVRPFRRIALGGLLLAATAFAGCSRPVGTVSGKVTVGTKTVKAGSISFVSTEGLPSATGGIQEDGSYTIPNVTGGHYKVCVETASVKGPSPAMFRGKPAKENTKTQAFDPGTKVPEGYTPSSPADASLAAARARAAKLYVPIPDEYADPTKTSLEYTVVGGDQTHNIELK